MCDPRMVLTTTRRLWGPPRPTHYWDTPVGPHSESPPLRETTLANLAYRGLTLLLSAMALTGQLAYLDVLYWNFAGLPRLGEGGLHPTLLAAVVTGAVVTTVAAATGLALAFRKGGSAGAHPFGLALAAWGYMLSYSGLTILLAPVQGSPLQEPFDAHFMLVEAVGSAALLRFTAVFPATLGPEGLRPPESFHVLLRPLQRGRVWLLSPSGPWVAGLGAWALVLIANAALGRHAEDAPLLGLADTFRLVALAAVVMNMRAAFLAADTAGRRALFWFVVGFTLLLGAVGALLGGNVLTAVTGWGIPGFNWRPVVLDAGVLGLIWGAAMGIVYRGELKPGPLARRTAVFASALTVALFLAAGMESLFTGALASRVTIPEGVGTVVAAIGMGLLYFRTHRPLESMIYHSWAESQGRADEG